MEQFIQQTHYELDRRHTESRLSSETIQTFIRQAENIWKTIEEIDKTTFMRRIKDKVIGCISDMLSEQQIDEASSWSEIKEIIKGKWREDNNLYMLRTEMNNLQQGRDETISEYAKISKQIMNDFHFYYENMSPEH